MTAPLYLLEPEAPGTAWLPFTGVRPVAELRAGVWLIRERWEAGLGTPARAVAGTHVTGFADVDTPPVVDPASIAGPAVVARSDFVPARQRLGFDGGRRLTSDGATVAWRLEAGESWPAAEGGDAREIPGLWLKGAWDLVTALETLLPPDCAEFAAAAADPVPDGCIVLGDPGQVVCLGAAVEPGVVFDVRAGAVVLAEGSTVRSGTRLEGPLFVGPGTRVLGGQLRRCAFGPQCRVHGEVTDTCFIGYGNKAHDGFLGHSVVGQWVNLGAGTITSNLKNTYGDIAIEAGGERHVTGRQFLGSLIGDHAKTAIGTLMGTGAVVGAGANLFGGRPGRWVPPFTWGATGMERMRLEGFLTIAERVMGRRGVEWTASREAALRALFTRHT